MYETARIDWTLEQQVRKDALVTELRAQGFGQRPLGHFWEMDHVVEVVRGGGGKFNPENLQTLCIPCHRRKTARLASERALMWRLGGALIRAGDPSVCVGKRKLIYLDVCRVKMLGFALHSLVVDVSQSLR